ncbi:MAG: NAD-dependent epimerase/dehydratase family protein [Pseudomonadota bacterium]
MQYFNLIIGAGFVGCVLAEQLRGAGLEVGALTRSNARHARLENCGAHPRAVDIFDNRVFAAALRDYVRHDQIRVFFLLPPSALADGHLDTVIEVLRYAFEERLARIVVASSTGVYGEGLGEQVSAATIPKLDNDRARRIFGIERAWQRLGSMVRICRLAGLYGPGRIIGERQLRAGESFDGNGDETINLIYVDDAAAALTAHAESKHAYAVELVTDGSPVLRKHLYAHTAELLGAPAPQFAGATRVRGSRTCDPQLSFERLGWRPAIGSYKEGLARALGNSPASGRAANPAVNPAIDKGT